MRMIQQDQAILDLAAEEDTWILQHSAGTSVTNIDRGTFTRWRYIN